MRRIALIINPVAGIGGRVGLKGSDGVVEQALRAGAVPRAEQRMAAALEPLRQIAQELLFLVPAGSMGANLLINSVFRHQLISRPTQVTTAEDTVTAAREAVKEGAECILFGGGDGTARDLYTAIGEGVPVIGVPCGVKIHSPVFARTPQHAGEAALRFFSGKIRLRSAEVVDLNEDAARNDKVQTRFYGCLTILETGGFMQNKKAGTPVSETDQQQALVFELLDRLETDILYLIGPGSTLRLFLENLGQSGTLLGIDVLRNRKIIDRDLSEAKILQRIQGQRCKLILTPTGGQGALLGRGNQQLSPEVLQKIGKENLIVAATMKKMASFHGAPLLVDTGELETDRMFSGYIRVITGVRQEMLYRVA